MASTFDARASDDVGTVEQRTPRRILEARTAYSSRDGDKLVVIVPAPHFAVSFYVEFPDPVGKQFIATGPITPEYFLREIAPNRTFGFRAEIERLY